MGTLEVKGKEEPQEAYELLKAGEVETRIGAAVAKGLTRFVGRKNSMAALKEAFEEAGAGSGQVVGIVGEAGVGKSRPLYELKNLLPQSESTYLEGRWPSAVCIGWPHLGSSSCLGIRLDVDHPGRIDLRLEREHPVCP